jgi:small-conductance mechanosensitive channel/CRP-like cAMP-binding protein
VTISGYLAQALGAVLLILVSRLPALKRLRRFTFPLVLLALTAAAAAAIDLLDLDATTLERLAQGANVLVLVFLATSMALAVLFHWLLGHRSEFPGLGRDLIAIVVQVAMLAVVLKYFFGVELTALLATSAIITVIVGLALQQTLGSLFSGIILAVEGKITPGRWVRAGKQIGRVEEHGWRSVTLRTTTDRLIMIPNSQIAGEHLELLGGGDTTMAVTIMLGVGYRAAPDQVKTVLLGVARDTPGLGCVREPQVLTHDFADSAIVYECRLWTATPWQEAAILDAFLTRAYRALERAGMEIPFPQRTVHLMGPEPTHDHIALASSALARCDLFSGLPEEGLSTLAHTSHLHTFAPGEAVMHEGELSQAMFVVAGGEAIVVRAIRSEETEVGRLAVGAVFGDIAFLLGLPRTATVRAASTLEVLEIDATTLRTLLEQLPDLAEELARRVAERKAGIDSQAEREQEAGPQTMKEILKGLLRIIGLRS